MLLDAHSVFYIGSVKLEKLNPLFKKNLLKNFVVVVQLELSAFSPHLSTPPQPNPPPCPASTLSLCFVHVSFIVVPENRSPYYLLPTPLWLLLDYS